MISLAMEAPISLLRELPYLTEFDFALTHLFEQSDIYSDYYEWAVKSGREVVLDNSVNELGEPVSLEEMDKVAKTLCPQYIIPPDHLNNLEATLGILDDAIELWGKDKLIPVVQGTNLEEVVECGKVLQNHYKFDIVSIPYDITLAHRSKLPDEDPTKASLEELGKTRIASIRALSKEGLLFKRVHLLGLNSLEELTTYHDQKIWTSSTHWSSVQPRVSIDTGAAITNAVWGQKFGMDPLIPKGTYFNYFDYDEFLQPGIKETWYWNICILKGYLSGRE